MHHRTSWAGTSATGLLALAILSAGCGDKNVVNVLSPLNAFNETRLVSDNASGGGAVIDPSLINPWGIAFSTAGTLWVSNNGTGVSTQYNPNGTKVPVTIAIPGAGGAGKPTGIVANGTADFVIPGVGPSAFIFASLDGTLSAASSATATAVLVVNQSAVTAEYTGIAMATNLGANFLYAANFRHNRVDMFNATFGLAGSFTDTTMAPGFAPYGIANIGGQLYVTYAMQQAPDSMTSVAGVGNGFVDVFNPDGSLARRFASNGNLNAPWAIVAAPAGFGPFSGAILVGNFGDGTIAGFSPSGQFIDFVRDSNGVTLTIDGLWGLIFGPTAGSTTLYFAAGTGGEQHGLVGTLTPR